MPKKSKTVDQSEIPQIQVKDGKVFAPASAFPKLVPAKATGANKDGGMARQWRDCGPGWARIKENCFSPLGCSMCLGLIMFVTLIWVGGLSYFLNKTAVDALSYSQVQWWNVFTFDLAWLWIFVNVPQLWYPMALVSAILIGILIFALIKRGQAGTEASK